MPASGVAFAVFGLAPAATALATVVPQALPGCALLATPDLLALHVPAAGAVTTTLPIPDLPALAGVVVHQQVVALELDTAGGIVAATSTDALRLTVGTY